MSSSKRWMGLKLSHLKTFEKKIVNNVEAISLAQYSMNLVRMFVFMKAWMHFNLGHMC